jgi:hypothetical protein
VPDAARASAFDIPILSSLGPRRAPPPHTISHTSWDVFSHHANTSIAPIELPHNYRDKDLHSRIRDPWALSDPIALSKDDKMIVFACRSGVAHWD